MIDRYIRAPLKTLWSEETRYNTWLLVELAACEAMEKEVHSPIPTGTAAKLREAANHMGPWDVPRLQALEAQTQHDVVAFLMHVEEKLGPEARFLHWGLTSSDVLDTTLALLLRDATELILQGIQQKLLPALQRQAQTHKDAIMIGRSHGIHAEPITVGVVFAGFYAEVQRAHNRLQEAQIHIAVGKLAGAVGVYGSGCLSPQGEQEALAQLGLVPEPIATQVIPRDRHAELFAALALLGAAIERLAITVRHWQRTEVGEAEESFGKKQKGSSAMPHKKNPILSENLCGLARLLRTNALAAMENIALWHERDISHSSVERVIAPDSTSLADFMVHRAASLVENLVLHPSRMQENLQKTQGLCFSEKILLALVAKNVARQVAYEWVQRNALAALKDQNQPFQKRVQEDPDIKQHLSVQEVKDCFSMEHHLRHVGAMLSRVFDER